MKAYHKKAVHNLRDSRNRLLKERDEMQGRIKRHSRWLRRLAASEMDFGLREEISDSLDTLEREV